MVTAAVALPLALPLAGRAADHVDRKVEAARRTGETVRVWVLDGTTGPYLALFLGALLLFGVLYEALPTAAAGRTLGKKLCGVRVLDARRQAPPTFGAALKRWLTLYVSAVALLGAVGLLRALTDRPNHRTWHDRAAGTYVAR
ncbi:hypothetical protein SRB5_41360 [Streptomyces sp. RB5]|uniref:RDD domain-containing protein n=1 Tax=Streptomyces smaragdinus TaxID=2585196 RepID=A0A7K0CKH1_9ACTN|nr:hypothetical protein [Streptomyces smaragdinus]